MSVRPVLQSGGARARDTRLRWLLPSALIALVAGAIELQLLQQDARLDRLTTEVAAARAEEPTTTPRAANSSRPTLTPLAATPSTLPAGTSPRSARAAAPNSQPTAARVPVPPGELSRVESALLQLLDGDRSELRARLGAIVRQQQEGAAREQRDERRENWLERRESGLAELGQSAGWTSEQQQSLLQIVLEMRDQIIDTAENAHTREERTVGRFKIQELRADAKQRIQGLLGPEQYEVYRERFGAEDDDRGPGQRPAPPNPPPPNR
jgi:hypothetical protein